MSYEIKTQTNGTKKFDQHWRQMMDRTLYLASLIDNISDALISTDLEFNIREWNAAAETMYGWRADEVMGQPLYRFVLSEFLEASRPEMIELVSQKGSWKGELTQNRRDGTRFPVMLSVSLIRDQEDQPVGFVAISRDITERKQAERALFDSERRYALLFDKAAIPVLLFCLPSFVIADANEALESFVGYSRPELLGKTALEIGITQREERDRVVANFIAQGSVSNEEMHVRTKSGEERTILVNMQSIELLEGPAALCTLQDISERKRMEEQLFKSEERFSKAFYSNPSALALLRLSDRQFEYVNDGFLKLVEYPIEDVLGKAAHELALFPDVQLMVHMEETLSRTASLSTIETSLRTGNGRTRAVLLSAEIIQLDRQPYCLVTLVNITERKQAEAQIQRQLKHLKALRMIDIAISSSFDLHVILEVILQQVLSQLGVDASALLLFNPTLQTIEYAATRGFRSDGLRQIRLKLGESYGGRAVLDRKTIHLPDLRHTGGTLPSSRLVQNESFVDYYGVPLIAKGEVKGVLEIYHRSHLHVDPQWLEFLEALAGQAAIAIADAQLFETLQRSNFNLEHRVAERTADLERANRVKDEFLATISQELRIPLTGLLGLSKSLLEQHPEGLTEAQKRTIQLIESSGRHLLKKVNDILQLSICEKDQEINGNFHSKETVKSGSVSMR